MSWCGCLWFVAFSLLLVPVRCCWLLSVVVVSVLFVGSVLLFVLSCCYSLLFVCCCWCLGVGSLMLLVSYVVGDGCRCALFVVCSVLSLFIVVVCALLVVCCCLLAVAVVVSFDGVVGCLLLL